MKLVAQILSERLAEKLDEFFRQKAVEHAGYYSLNAVRVWPAAWVPAFRPMYWAGVVCAGYHESAGWKAWVRSSGTVVASDGYQLVIAGTRHSISELLPSGFLGLWEPLTLTWVDGEGPTAHVMEIETWALAHDPIAPVPP